MTKKSSAKREKTPFTAKVVCCEEKTLSHNNGIRIVDLAKRNTNDENIQQN